MMVTYDDPMAMLDWAKAITPTGAPFREDARAIGQTDDAGALCAVVVFDTFSPWDCQVHVCVNERKWITPELMRHCCSFAFQQCGYRRVGAAISSAHRPALSLARWMGFKREGLHPAAGMQGEGMVSLGLLREDCRWLPRTLVVPRQSPMPAL